MKFWLSLFRYLKGKIKLLYHVDIEATPRESGVCDKKTCSQEF